ncbi:glutaredoxin family protein [Aquimonas voraii]|uniref:Glutaredoxin n=1 Tax=Aquimonas voraii TaxID=265719 RepID=A0A1G6SB64_9GAMM|nr:glutaredoxin domain-containing protein [Aquimonas voraii]SDD13367.1 Glutaredoxin [Aquimonas voraii]
MSGRVWLVLLALLVAFGVWRSEWSTQAALDSLPGAGDPSRVVMVSAEWCGYCQKQLAEFRSAGVRFTELDFDTAAGREAVEALGGRGVPMTVIGDEIIHGYNRPALQQHLAAVGYEMR